MIPSANMSNSTTLTTLGTPSIPNGLSMGPSPRVAPRENATEIVPTATTIAVSHATHHQRPGGSRPSGNTRATYTKRLKYGTRIQDVIQANTSPHGSEPGSASNAYMAYSA